jgi:hypothetical protein
LLRNYDTVDAHTAPLAKHQDLLAGGTDGNERLTVLTGALLFVLFAALGVTILRIGQLISIHLFLGLVLLGPVALKLASTGYRFTRYYTHNPAYRRKGPPQPLLRLLAPFVALTTFVVFGSGLVLLFEGPASRGTLTLIHKASFFVWLALMGVHVLGHLPEMSSLWSARASSRRPTPGGTGRTIALAGGLVLGLLLAVLLLGQFSAWTAAGALHHDHSH